MDQPERQRLERPGRRSHGTPPVSDLDAVRLADLLGTGVAGVLWSATPATRPGRMFFLDFTGGVKPYLLPRWTTTSAR